MQFHATPTRAFWGARACSRSLASLLARGDTRLQPAPSEGYARALASSLHSLARIASPAARNTFADNTLSGGSSFGGCDVYLLDATTSGSELVGNMFLSRTAACASGIMLQLDRALPIRCELGEWMTPAPLIMPPTALSGCHYQCNPGTFGSSRHLTTAECTAPCTAGHHCPLGSAAPVPCPVNTYMPTTGAAVCTACPPFSTTSGAMGASSIAACECAAGFYASADPDTGAVVCPPGSNRRPES